MLFKKYPKLEEIQIKESWSIGQGIDNGNPFIVRINKGFKKISGHPDFHTRIGIAIPFVKETDNGFPSKEQQSILNEIEDGIINIVEKDKKTFLVICITGVGFKEYVLHSAEPEKFEIYFEEIKKINSKYEYQYYIEEDKKWNLYKVYSRF
jgi:hypothetical protein